MKSVGNTVLTRTPAPTILIQRCFMIFPQESGMDTIWDLQEPECPSHALNPNNNEPPFIDRSQAFSAKMASPACPGAVPIAYWIERCRRQAQPQASAEARASSEGESSLW